MATMAEVWDLAQYVEDNPNDFEQRWRLAKKLYKAWEYRLALEHLQVLRKDWEPRLNVFRYLAATYYRLGRYDEAARELRDGIAIWPQEIGLREQLARVLEVSGDRLGAAEVWEAIAELDPHHPIAASAAKRLRDKQEDDAKSDLNLHMSDSGIDLAPGRVCRNCGAQNSDDAERCWQCQAPLFTIRPTPRPVAHAREERQRLVTPDTIILLLGLLSVAALSGGVYLTVKYLFMTDAEAPVSISGLFRAGLAGPRLITGIVLLVAWPIALWMALSFVTDRINGPAAILNITGVLSTALVYAASWLSPGLFLGALFCAALLTLGVIAGGLRIPVAKAVFAWAIHLVIVLVVVLVLFVGAVRYSSGIWLNPMAEFSAASAYARDHAGASSDTPTVLDAPEMPFSQRLVWHPSGSAWIDAEAGVVTFVVKSPGGSGEMKFELQDETGTVFFDYVRGTNFTKTLGITTGKSYTVIVDGEAGMQAQVEIFSLIRPDLV
jgi:hypothetical protein